MRFIIEFDTDNAAFEGGNLERGVCRVLAKVAKDVSQGIGRHGDRGRIGDVNGNSIGTWRYVE